LPDNFNNIITGLKDKTSPNSEVLLFSAREKKILAQKKEENQARIIYKGGNM